MTRPTVWCTAEDGCRLAYTVTGQAAAPPIVLSNSLGTDRGLWDLQVDALSRDHLVVTYDTRGHGMSDAPAGPYSIARLGRDVLALMDHVGAAQADVCGISIGGLTALWLGVHAPDRVRRLVLANTGARIGSVESWTDRMRVVKSGGPHAIAEATMARWFTDGFRAAHPTVVARVRTAFESTPATGYLACCAALRDADLRATAARVVAPVLVITGTHDPATPPADGAWLAATIPGATLVELDAAHLSNIERADLFTGAVRTFLVQDAAEGTRT